MASLVSVLMFLVFLLVYGVVTALTYKLFMRVTGGLLRHKTFLFLQELLLLIGGLTPFFFIWILTGFLNLRMVGVVLVGAHLSAMLSWLLWALLGSPHTPWKERAFWAGGEWTLKNPKAVLFISALAFFALLAYPIIAGFISFQTSLLTDRSTLAIVKLTFIWAACNLFLSSVTALGVLASEDINEDTRTRAVVVQSGGLVNTALFLSLLLWSFGVGSQGPKLEIPGTLITISPVLVIILVVYFAALILLPYVSGVQRARRLRQDLFSKRVTRLDETMAALEFPIVQDRSSRLQQVEKRLESDLAIFSDEDDMIGLGLEFDELDSADDLPPEKSKLSPLFQSYKRSRTLDPRFQHVDALTSLQNEITALAQQFTGLPPTQIEQMAGTYTAHLRERRKDLTDLLEKEDKSRPAVWMVLAVVLSPILGAILSKFGEWAWKAFQGSLHL